jgi:Undecaprenyl-phosphate glucose phosphotransferase
MTSTEPSAKFRNAVRALASSEAALVSAGADSVGGAPSSTLSDMAREVASHFSDRPISAELLFGWLRCADFSILFGSGCVVAALHRPSMLDWGIATICLVAGIMAVLFNQAADSYQISTLRSAFSQIARVISAWTVTIVGTGLLFLMGGALDEHTSGWLASWYLAGAGLIIMLRVMLAKQIGTWIADGRLERRAVIVGGGSAAAELIQAIEAQRGSEIRICGIFDDRADDRSPAMIKGYPKLGNVADLVEFGRITMLDMLIVTIPLRAESRVLELLRKLWVLPVDIHLSAHADKLKFRPRSYTYLGNVPMLAIFDKPLADWDAVGKRAFDLVFGVIAIILTAPIMLAAAIAIKLDSKGPVFFRQKRYGFNNEVVNILKFRSMYVEQADPEARNVVTKGDPRVTRVGRFIRKTSIDELPQLFNVLMGSLALVGPRPHALRGLTQNRLFEQVVDGYFARHKVKPGVTGWAQINGWRGEVDTPEKIRKRVEYDLYYIENWSLFFDFKILVMTPFKIIGQEGAY